MIGRWHRVAATLGVVGVLIGLALVSGGGDVSQAKPASSDGDGQSVPQTHQTAIACVRSGKRVCDPAAFATLQAGNPMSQPTSANPTYITLEEIAARARGSAAASPEFHARFMKYRDAAPLFGMTGSALVNPERMVWVITAHQDVWTPGGVVRPPELKHYYSVLMDGETGMVSDSCIGCNLITS